MIRKKKMYARPKQIYEAGRIKEENVLVKKYGLKNKTEIWKTLAKVNYFRKRAMELAKLPLEEQEILLIKLRNLGLDVKTISDVLGLKVENILERRLQTIVAKIGLANTPKQSRQMIIHKKILISGKAVNSPGYLVKVAEEDKIQIKQKGKKTKPKEEPQEVRKNEKTQENKEEKE